MAAQQYVFSTELRNFRKRNPAVAKEIDEAIAKIDEANLFYEKMVNHRAELLHEKNGLTLKIKEAKNDSSKNVHLQEIELSVVKYQKCHVKKQ